MIVRQATNGAKGFDVDQILSAEEAAAFKNAGYSFCLRYIPRVSNLTKGNLSATELGEILSTGLGVGVVQHVGSGEWGPSANLGQEYGKYAGEYAKGIGLPSGMLIWLDLEMVSTAAKVEDTIAYCQSWFNEVQAVGYVAALYVGWQTGLTSQQLYNLPFKNYWRGYNADIAVATRGYQLLQHSAPSVNGIQIDSNTVQADQLGDLPTFLFNS